MPLYSVLLAMATALESDQFDHRYRGLEIAKEKMR